MSINKQFSERDVEHSSEHSSENKKSPVNVNVINHNIKVLMDFLADNCTEEGVYWLYKKEGEMELNVINISEFVGKDCDEDLHMTEEEREEKEINWKYI